MRRNKFLGALVALLLLLTSPHSNASEWGPVWDKLAEQPGATVIDDAGTRRIHLPSGVEFWLHKSGDNLTVTGNDNSGHGAVMCSWGLYISFRSYLNVCPGEDSANLANDLNNAIDRMNDFIVENSIQPTTKAAVEADVERRFQTDLDKMKNLSPDQIGKVCGPRGWGYAITERLKAMSHEERVSEIDKLLSVKRPAVMNPCL